MAKSTKGTKICVTKAGAAGTTVTATAATKAKPAEITATNTLADGDLIYLPSDATGLSEIDGKTWVVAGATGTKFTLLGSDTTASTGTFTAGTAMTGYKAADIECICFSGITLNRDNAQPISVATFCDTTATIAGPETSAGSLEFTGYADSTKADYKALLALQESGDIAHWRVEMPGNGYLVFDATVDSVNIGIPLEGAYTYSGSATLSSKARHLFA